MMKILRSIYDYLLRWSATPAGLAVVCLVAGGASLIGGWWLPEPLFFFCALAAPQRVWRLAAAVTLASLGGGVLGYALAIAQPDTMTQLAAIDPAMLAQLESLYQRHPFLAVWGAAIVPAPFAAFAFAAGHFHISFFTFIVATLCGRAIRFGLLAAVMWQFGDWMRTSIERYFSQVVLVTLGALLSWSLLR